MEQVTNPDGTITWEVVSNHVWDSGTKLVNNPVTANDYYVPEGDKWAYFKYIEDKFLQIGNTSYGTEEINKKLADLRDTLKTDVTIQEAMIANIGDRVNDIDYMIQHKEIPTN